MIKFKMKEIMDVKNQAKQLDMFHCFIKKIKEEEEDSFVRYYNRDLFFNILIMLQ